MLDPACGTGNFLYVSMELMKRLEGEVLEALLDLGGQEALSAGRPHRRPAPVPRPGDQPARRGDRRTGAVDRLSAMAFPHQGRRAGRADPEGLRTITAMDAVLRRRSVNWCGTRWPAGDPDECGRRSRRGLYYRIRGGPNGRRRSYIVGNPPFIGGKDIRGRAWATATREALWRLHPHINESADFVMYWWDRAAEILTRKGTRLRRFGLVTTNSITQVFSAPGRWSGI